MAAALFRRGTGLCVRCIHRELCRVVWRPQTALFSSKQSDRKQPRRTHIKKAKPQPTVDVAKLLEQLFSQRRPGTAPPAGKARPTKASSMPTTPPTTSSVKGSISNAPPLSKTDPSVSVFPAASSFKQADSVPKEITSTFNASPTNPKTVNPSETPQQSTLDFIPVIAADGVSNVTVPPTSTTPASLGSEVAAVECQTSTKTVETNVETATEPVELKTATLSAATVETTTEPPVEPYVSPVERLEGRAAAVEAPVEPTVDVPAEEVQTKGTDSGVVDVLQTTKEEPLIKTAIESSVEASHFHMETLESRAAVVERPVEPMTDITVDVAAETQNTNSGVIDISQTATVEALLETTVEPSVEASTSPQETLGSRSAVTEGTVETAIEPEADTAAQAVETNSTDSGVTDISQTATVEPLLETIVELSVEASTSPLETLEGRAAVAECPVEPTVDAPAQALQTNSTDSGTVKLSHIAEEEPLIETTVEPSVEASTSPLETLGSGSAVAEGSVETTIETEADTAAQAVETKSTDSVVHTSYGAKEESFMETTEPAVEASTAPLEGRAAVSESTVEPAIENEAADSLNAQESAPLPLKNQVESTLESTVESSSGHVAAEEGVKKSEQMTLESVTLHVVEVQVESLKTDELLQTKSVLDEKAEEQLQELLVQTGSGAEYKAAAETANSSEDESEILTKALSNWDSLSEDLQELEGESGVLVKELFCHVPAAVSKTPGTVKMSSASDPPVATNRECLKMEEEGTEAEAMTLESITLSKVKAEVGGFETEVLLETRNALEKEAEALAKEEKMEVETTIEDVVEDALENATEAELLKLDFISEATDALEAETSVMLEAMFGSEQGPKQPPDTLLIDKKLRRQDETIDQEAEKESGEQEGGVLEAMTLESVTLAEVEASLGTLESQSLSETTDYLEKEAEILAGEERVELEDGVASEETTEALTIESLSLPEGDDLSEDLQTDRLLEELLFSVPGHVTRITEGRIEQEDVRVNILDATAATGSVDVDSAAAVTDDSPASPAQEETLLGQEVEEEGAQTEALGNEDGKGTHTDLDPVQRLFLEKIREYNNMRRLNGGPLEAEPDFKKYLSEETAKLQRLYGGGDLSSFPEFSFTEPEMDQDSK